MTSILLGSGASEGIPCSMCNCDICTKARNSKGKDIRTRSDFLIDASSIIDFSPDLFYQLLSSGTHLRELKNIFLTHFHEDHVSVPEMGCRNSAIPHLTTTVNVYGSSAALEQINLLFYRYKDHTRKNANNYFSSYNLISLDPFNDYLICGMKVTPILSSHYGYGINEVGYNYIITDKNGRTFLYAVDTGWFWDETWDYLRQLNIEFDYVVLECTYGDFELPKYQSGHLNIDNMLDMVKEFESIGLVSNKTPVILSHICHIHSKTHEETQKLFDNCGYNIKVGYDGMLI